MTLYGSLGYHWVGVEQTLHRHTRRVTSIAGTLRFPGIPLGWSRADVTPAHQESNVHRWHSTVLWDTIGLEQSRRYTGTPAEQRPSLALYGSLGYHWVGVEQTLHRHTSRATSIAGTLRFPGIPLGWVEQSRRYTGASGE